MYNTGCINNNENNNDNNNNNFNNKNNYNNCCHQLNRILLNYRQIVGPKCN